MAAFDAMAGAFGIKPSTLVSMVIHRILVDPELLQLAYVQPLMAGLVRPVQTGADAPAAPAVAQTGGNGANRPHASMRPCVHAPTDHASTAAGAAAAAKPKAKGKTKDPALWDPFCEAWSAHRDSGASLGNKASGRNNGWRQWQRLLKSSGITPADAKARWLRRLAARGQYCEQPQRMLNPDNGMLTDGALDDIERNARARSQRENETRMKPSQSAGNPGTSLEEIRAAKRAAQEDAAIADAELDERMQAFSKKLGARS